MAYGLGIEAWCSWHDQVVEQVFVPLSWEGWASNNFGNTIRIDFVCESDIAVWSDWRNAEEERIRSCGCILNKIERMVGY